MLLLRFALVADVQHADKADGGGERVAYYRSAPAKLARAVDAFIDSDVEAVINLGDSIDGNEDRSLDDLERVAVQFDRLRTVHTVLGNHCLAVDRELFMRRLRMPSAYYATELGPWRLIVCDTNDLGLLWPDGSQKLEEAKAYYEAHSGDHMKPWNGGVGAEQMAWLRSELESARLGGQCVVFASHHPICGARPTHLAWNHRELYELLNEFADVVKLALAGHDHVGAYARSDNGIHFVTLEAILEAKDNAFAIVDVIDDTIHIHGTGSATSRTLLL